MMDADSNGRLSVARVTSHVTEKSRSRLRRCCSCQQVETRQNNYLNGKLDNVDQFSRANNDRIIHWYS